MYEVYGYDKDGDVGTLLCTAPDLGTAVLNGDILGEQCREGRLARRCSDGTYEPFDWIIISKGDGLSSEVKKHCCNAAVDTALQVCEAVKGSGNSNIIWCSEGGFSPA